MKKYQIFLSKKIKFLEVKFSTYLNRRVIVMKQNKHNYHKTAVEQSKGLNGNLKPAKAIEYHNLVRDGLQTATIAKRQPSETE